MEQKNYTVIERKYTIQFIFKSKYEASKFKIPTEYKDKFELTTNLDKERSTYIRIAQIKAR